MPLPYANALFGFNTTQKEELIKYIDYVLANGVAADLADVEADVASIATWGAALATKLNADAGVTDANYDTTPLA
jgi:hypothetical protein